MEIKAIKTPITDAYTNPDGGLGPVQASYTLEHANKISLVIQGVEKAWTLSDGFHGTKVYGAVGNDIADEIEIDSDVNVQYGKAYVFTDGSVRPSLKKAEKGFFGIATDTASLIASNSEDKGHKMKIAVAGFVPAFVDKEYRSGTPLTYGKDGTLTRAGLFLKLFRPQTIIATYYKKSRLSVWNGIDLGERVLVRVV